MKQSGDKKPRFLIIDKKACHTIHNLGQFKTYFEIAPFF